MNKNNEKALYDRFKTMYSGVDLPPTESLMCFGFECGDGWFNIIWNLSEELEKLHPNIKATQVKEKYGTLRFYIAGVPHEVFDDIYMAIDQATLLSAKTCEECGAPGQLCHAGYWFRTLCPECAKKSNYEACPPEDDEEEQ